MHYENLTTILQELLTVATTVQKQEVQVLEQEILQAVGLCCSRFCQSSG